MDNQAAIVVIPGKPRIYRGKPENQLDPQAQNVPPQHRSMRRKVTRAKTCLKHFLNQLRCRMMTLQKYVQN